jgi:hypothetical protein
MYHRHKLLDFEIIRSVLGADMNMGKVPGKIKEKPCLP